MSEEASELIKKRYEKLQKLRQHSIDPYPNRFFKTHDIKRIKEAFFPQQGLVVGHVKTAGRVVSHRPMGKAVFFVIQDEADKIQIYASNETLNEIDFLVLQNLDLGDIVGVEGETFRTRTQEPSIRAHKLTLLAKNLSPLPVVKEKEGVLYDALSDVEFRYRKRYVDLIVTPKTRHDFKLRSSVVQAIRQFMQEEGFMEVETPMMQLVASGAAAKPFITHHNALDMDLYLRIAPELYLKRLIVGGFEKVFELNRNFRNEGISTKHNPEFTMMEAYQAYADYETMMDLTQRLFVFVADKVLGTQKITYGEHIIDLTPPWPRKNYLDLLHEYSGIDFKQKLQEKLSLEEAKELARKLQVPHHEAQTIWEVLDEVFSHLVEPKLIQPVFVQNYPKAMSPLAKSIPGDEFLVERFEPYIAGREMGNAFTELNDPEEQLRRFEEQLRQREQGARETMELDEDFIEALKVGMPPTGGLGLGIDRMVMLFTNNHSIKDVILFPLLRPRESKK
ncbi:MAG: lysine--tRNA ligase [Leptospiraceae bacterium]|nr:lysine--tRNA ligase [Leptospiraceae bacterium]MDW8307096.1 lysine--tRNA ligase [Leptospiraceae bacterium]